MAAYLPLAEPVGPDRPVGGPRLRHRRRRSLLRETRARRHAAAAVPERIGDSLQVRGRDPRPRRPFLRVVEPGRRLDAARLFGGRLSRPAPGGPAGGALAASLLFRLERRRGGWSPGPCLTPSHAGAAH